MRILLLGFLACAATAFASAGDADFWLPPGRFVVPTAVHWDEGLAQRPAAERVAIQKVLAEAYRVAERHLPYAENTLLHWSEPLPAGRQILITLTDKRLNAMAGMSSLVTMPALVAPSVSPTATVVQVVLDIPTLMFRNGSLRSDALGRVVATLGTTLFGDVPEYLPLSDGEFRGLGELTEYPFPRHVSAAKRTTAFLGRVLADTTAPYAQRLPAYRSLMQVRTAHHAALTQTLPSPRLLAVPFTYRFFPNKVSGSIPQKLTATAFDSELLRALHLVAQYPPDHRWNNVFSWPVPDAGQIARKSVLFVLDDAPLATLNEAAAAMRLPLRDAQLWGETSSAEVVAMPGGETVTQFQVTVRLNAVFFTGQEGNGVRDDAFMRLVAFLGGQLYGPMISEQLKLAPEDMPVGGPVVDRTERLALELQTLTAARSLLRRIQADADGEWRPGLRRAAGEMLSKLNCGFEVLELALAPPEFPDAAAP